MKVVDLMTPNPFTCSVTETLEAAMRVMWEHDCGILPILDEHGAVVGMLTDRDVAVAAYTQGRPLANISVTTAMSRRVCGVLVTDSIDRLEAVMSKARVRRVPVLNGAGQLEGVVSMNDLARHVCTLPGGSGDGLRASSIVQTLAAISEPWEVRSEHRSEVDGSGIATEL